MSPMEDGASPEVEALAARMPEKLLFQGLSPEQCRKVAEIVSVERCERGHVIVSERDYGDSLYVLEEGSVEVRVASSEGDKLVCELDAADAGQVSFAGDFFGEMCLLDLEPRCANVTALEPCVLWEINRDRLYWLFGDDKDLQLRILLAVARVLSRRLNLMDQAAAQRQD